MKVRYLQIVPSPDDIEHAIYDEPTECLCGPGIDYSREDGIPIITHRPLQQTERTQWHVLTPGQEVDVVRAKDDPGERLK